MSDYVSSFTNARPQPGEQMDGIANGAPRQFQDGEEARDVSTEISPGTRLATTLTASPSSWFDPLKVDKSNPRARRTEEHEQTAREYVDID